MRHLQLGNHQGGFFLTLLPKDTLEHIALLVYNDPNKVDLIKQHNKPGARRIWLPFIDRSDDDAIKTSS